MTQTFTRSAASQTRELSEAQTAAVDRINQQVGEARTKYLTPIPGQEMIYNAKDLEARAFLAASTEPTDLTPYPFLEAEIGITAPNAHDLATLWVQMAAAWKAVGPQLESKRLTAIGQVMAATTKADITAAVAALEDDMTVF